MHTYRFDREQLVRRPRSEVFAFFADPMNLERLTPPFLGFHMLTKTPIEMREGTLIDYRISVHGIPLRWRTLIERYDPERSFVDVQLRGPYRSWRHTHTFVETPDGTLVSDRVEYAVPFGPLGRIANTLLVERDLTRIFEFRRQTMETLFR
ncbi:MAG TPA: SRPBCC family protein [Polyangiales bacterium]|nr:SRPBCC family protein [Polyangiales bacterium]